MIKLVGSTFIVFALGTCGWVIANNYIRRPKELREIQSAFNILETEISYAVNTLPEALDNVCRQSMGTTLFLFETMRKMLEDEGGYSAEEAWKHSVESMYKVSALCEEDKNVLIEFGSMLGTFGREEQLRHLELLIKRLSVLEEKALCEAEKNSRLYKYFGISLGLIIVILLI